MIEIEIKQCGLDKKKIDGFMRRVEKTVGGDPGTRLHTGVYDTNILLTRAWKKGKN